MADLRGASYSTVEVLPGAGTIVRTGDVLLWWEPGPTAPVDLAHRLVALVADLSDAGDEAGAEAGGRLAGELREVDAQAVAALVLVVPSATGLRVVVHGTGRVLAHGIEINRGWEDKEIGWPDSLALGRADAPLRPPTAGSPYDLIEGGVPGAGAAIALVARQLAPSAPAASAAGTVTAVPSIAAPDLSAPPQPVPPAPVSPDLDAEAAPARPAGPTVLAPGTVGSAPVALTPPVATTPAPADPWAAPAGVPPEPVASQAAEPIPGDAPAPAPDPWTAPAGAAPEPIATQDVDPAVESAPPEPAASSALGDPWDSPPNPEPSTMHPEPSILSPDVAAPPVEDQTASWSAPVPADVMATMPLADIVAASAPPLSVDPSPTLAITPQVAPPPARPPEAVYGAIVLDDGSVHALDADYVIGSAPESSPDVIAGRLRPIPVVDPSGQAHPAHAEVRHGDGGSLLLVARATTFTFRPGDDGWQEAPLHVGVPLEPGVRVSVGQRTFTLAAPTS